MKSVCIAVFFAAILASPPSIQAAPDSGVAAQPVKVEPTVATKVATEPAAKPEAKAEEKAPEVKEAAPTEKVEQAPSAQQWWQVLLAELLKLFLVIFVPVLSTLTVSLLKRWKINVEFDQVNSIASKAAGWAEQKALTALKEGADKTSSADKMKLALDFANGLADQYKLPAKATEKLQDLIESALGQEKVKASATIDVENAATSPE